MSWLTRREIRHVPVPQGAVLNARPLYLQLRDLMVSRIVNQQWQIGEALPNEVLLSKEFNVSVGTVRKAMDELSTEGLIRRQQGRGTFIADRQTATIHGLCDRIRTRDGAFIDWSPPQIAVAYGVADMDERRALALMGPDPEVIRFKRVRTAGTRRLVLERSAVPASRFSGQPALLDQCADIAPLAQAFKIMLGRAEVRLSTVPVSAAIAEDLTVTEHTTIQKIDRVVFDIDGEPVETCQSWLSLVDEYYSCSHSIPEVLDG